MSKVLTPRGSGGNVGLSSMSPLPRLLATGLFVLLAALTALLVAPAWQGTFADPTGLRPIASAGGNGPVAARPALLAPKVSLGLALGAMGLAAALVISLARHSAGSGLSKSPFATARAELTTWSKLAESSVAQGVELNRERDVRRRAEQDVQLKQRLLNQSLEEKIRLGQDLHDGIIQSLYAVGLTLESARALLRSKPDDADQRLEQCRTALNGAIRDARNYLTGLAPESLRHTNFASALTSLLEELCTGCPAEFEIRADADAAALLTPEQALDVLQIARESASNALRHGGASHVTVRMHQGDRQICLLVQDNGAGFDPATQRDGGHGLVNMRARAEHMHGTLEVSSRPGQGTRVLANIPIMQPSIV